MAFNQFKLTRSVSQSRGIFDRYIYETDDTISTVLTPGYFTHSRYKRDSFEEWAGSFLDAKCSDGYVFCQISDDGNSVSQILTGEGNVGASTFLQLSDTPEAYSEGQLVPVINSSLDGLEFSNSILNAVGGTINIGSGGAGGANLFPNKGGTVNICSSVQSGINIGSGGSGQLSIGTGWTGTVAVASFSPNISHIDIGNNITGDIVIGQGISGSFRIFGYFLPINDGPDGSVLTTDGARNTSWNTLQSLLSNDPLNLPVIARYRARFSSPGTQGIASGTGSEALIFAEELEDTANISSDGTTFTAPPGSAAVKIKAQATWVSNGNAGLRQIFLRHNGGVAEQQVGDRDTGVSTSLDQRNLFSSPRLPCSAGDTFQIRANQNSAANANVTSENNGTWVELEFYGTPQ